jgi:hypothetical protein
MYAQYAETTKEYSRQYPRDCTVRLKRRTVNRLRHLDVSGTSLDHIINKIAEFYEVNQV